MSLDQRVRSAVAALLYAAGESQTDLAAVLGVSQTQVGRRQSGTAAWSLADCDAVAAHFSSGIQSGRPRAGTAPCGVGLGISQDLSPQRGAARRGRPIRREQTARLGAYPSQGAARRTSYGRLMRGRPAVAQAF
ncbi:helix-turn-helix domain-containing protein [Streptomyces avermitilis]